MQYRADNHCARVYVEQTKNQIIDFVTYIIIIVITRPALR